MDFNQLSEFILQKENLSRLKIGLTGDLGAGKTWLVENLLKKLSPQFENQISSPTFTYCNIYESEDITIHHYDLYRIEEEGALMEIGFFESLENEQVLCFIEWIDHFEGLEKFCDILIHIDHNEPGKPVYSVKEFNE